MWQMSEKSQKIITLVFKAVNWSKVNKVKILLLLPCCTYYSSSSYYLMHQSYVKSPTREA